MATVNQLFGISPETESSWGDYLSSARADFILEFVERAQASDQAVVNGFLEFLKE
jgi:hypothetical protein